MKRLQTAARVGRAMARVGQPYDVQSEGAANMAASPPAPTASFPMRGPVPPPGTGRFACPYPEKLASDSVTLL
jgi:hypothetical protein